MICVYTVCSDLSVRKLGIFKILYTLNIVLSFNIIVKVFSNSCKKLAIIVYSVILVFNDGLLHL